MYFSSSSGALNFPTRALSFVIAVRASTATLCFSIVSMLEPTSATVINKVVINTPSMVIARLARYVANTIMAYPHVALYVVPFLVRYLVKLAQLRVQFLEYSQSLQLWTGTKPGMVPQAWYNFHLLQESLFSRCQDGMPSLIQ